MQDWEAANRSTAATVGTAAAVSSLFAAPYAGEALNDRGCSDDFQFTCTWGPYGGANPSETLYELYMTHVAAGWYVSSVQVDS
jgi:hypothetical protein